MHEEYSPLHSYEPNYGSYFNVTYVRASLVGTLLAIPGSLDCSMIPWLDEDQGE